MAYIFGQLHFFFFFNISPYSVPSRYLLYVFLAKVASATSAAVSSYVTIFPHQRMLAYYNNPLALDTTSPEGTVTTGRMHAGMLTC